MSLNCDSCGSRIKVRISGGEFLVTDGSTLDNINFDSVEDVVQRALGTMPKNEDGDEEERETLIVEVECTQDPTHLIFQTSVSKIKLEIYQRLHMAAERMIRKYYC